MGYTHHEKIVGVKGLYFGAKGSEVQAPIATNVSISVATTAAGTQYTVAPITGTVLGYAVFSVSAGTGRTVAVSSGSAGPNLAITAVTGVTGTIGATVVMAASSGGNSVTAGDSILVTVASCATVQTAVTATLLYYPSTT
jgi:hypothetical protein